MIKMNNKEKLSTEEKIIRAAEEVFTSRGKAGGRMKDIANRAGINQALLHYYFRSKDRLFREVFTRAVPKVLPGVFGILGEDLPLFEKIEKFIRGYLEVLEAHPGFPMLIIRALDNSPETFADTILSAFDEMGFDPVEAIGRDVEKEIKAGRIIEIEPRDLMVNIMSMAIFPFVARPLIERMIFSGDTQSYGDFLRRRKDHITEFIIGAIKKG
jgi:AcrR family transcriptional regulator